MKKEKVLCFERNNLPKKWLFEKDVLKLRYDDFILHLNKINHYFLERAIVEDDANYKQIIPYVVIKNSENKILCYKRGGSEKRIHGLWSVGVGGHVDLKDDSNFGIKNTIETGLRRELIEELDKEKISTENIDFLGIMNEELTSVGKVHIAAVFCYKMPSIFRPKYSEELKEHKWLLIEEIRKNYKLELWSEMVLNLLEEK